MRYKSAAALEMAVKATASASPMDTGRAVSAFYFQRMQQFSIDLVVDEVLLEEAERVAPADRIEVEGLRTCDYLVYPVESALADKFCVLIETHEGRGSSRVKDLVDIMVYATTCAVNGKKLQRHVCREVAVRGIGLPVAFDVPEGWGASHARRFKRLCAQTKLPAGLAAIDAAGGLARRLFAPAVSGEAEGVRWNPSELRWEGK